MQMDPRIILAGQAPDIIGSMGRGMQLRQQERDNQHVNSLRDMLQEYGPGIASGEQNALAQYARFDPAASLGIQQTRQSMDVQRQQLDMARAAASRAAATHAAQMDEVTRQREAQILERGIAMLTQATTPEAFAQVMQMPGVAQAAEGMFGPGMATFENRNLLIAGALGVSDALSMGQQAPQFRAAAPEEAAQYGAAGGQFGPDGRFYPVNPPSGFSVETGPDGTTRVMQGAGVGSQRPFTEGQSRDVVYASRARGALEAFEPVAEALTSRGELLADMAPMGLARQAQSPEFQRARVAGDEFLQAILRKDTGAAITRQEREEYGRVYLPQPGDTPEVLDLRRQARARALAALEAGMNEAQIRAQTRALGADIEMAAMPSQSSPPAAPPRQPAAQVAAPDQAVRMLLDDPSPDAQREFDAIFGAGAAQQILGAIR